MLIIPAIDLLGGKCVRLRQGSYSAVKEYSANPIEVARQFAKAGAKLLHIVDLDGARAGSPVNREVVLKIQEETDIPVQVGGGIRNYETAANYLKNGIARVILGTAAVENGDLIKKLVTDFGSERIIISADVKEGLVATNGWEALSQLSLDSFLDQLQLLGCKRIILTDTKKDGLLTGPNFELVQQATSLGFSVISAGGISTTDDLMKLTTYGAEGAIVGTALYENKIDLAEAVRALSNSSPLPKRVIPCLDIKDGRVTKGVHFANLKDTGDAVELAEYYSRAGADELVFLDILATVENRHTFVELVRRIAQRISIPFTVGGGIKSIEQIRDLLRAGADKISLGSAAIENPELVKSAAQEFGSQCIVISVDAKRTEEKWNVYIRSGREDTGIDAVEFAKNMEALGAGELLVNSLDRDGTKKGYDIPLLKAITNAVNIPVIASSGAGKREDFLEVLQATNVDAVLAASLFHFGEITIPEQKQYLSSNNIKMRI